MVKWPNLLDGGGITVRHGARGEIFVPLGVVGSVEDVSFRPEEKGSQIFRAALLAQPNIAIRLSEPLPFKRRLLSCITMRLDEPSAFIAAVKARIDEAVEQP
jgi:hypothetical protein